MFLRLTSHSELDWLTSPIDFGKPADISPFGRGVMRGGFGPGSSEWPCPGAFPDYPLASYQSSYPRAPEKSATPVTWSATTPVDLAGWTQVVIQEGQFVPSDVKTGPPAGVSASINWVLEGVLKSPLRLDNYGTGTSGNNTCGCPGWSDMSD